MWAYAIGRHVYVNSCEFVSIRVNFSDLQVIMCIHECACTCPHTRVDQLHTPTFVGNTLQHTATQCNKLVDQLHTPTFVGNTLQHTATQCNKLVDQLHTPTFVEKYVVLYMCIYIYVCRCLGCSREKRSTYTYICVYIHMHMCVQVLQLAAHVLYARRGARVL